MTAVYSQIIQYIDAHIKSEITITDIAEMAGYSANHIYKMFKVYSPYPIMEYIRRKKLYFAVNDLYTGSKIYDIAQDYGFDTLAGFYKAFKSVFGCSPGEYRKNMKKEGIFVFIDNIKNINELDAVMTFVKSFNPTCNFDFCGEGDHKYSRNFWLEEWKKSPELLLYAKENDEICGIILGWSESYNKENITIAGDCVAEAYQNKGLHEALFIEIEKRAKKLGYKGIGLGIAEGQEEFYANMGFIGKTLIQSEKYSVDELIAFNEQYKNYEVTGAGVYDGYVNQLWINASILDKGLKKHYEEEIGDCWVCVVVGKAI